MFSCNLLPALLAERPGSFTCHCGSTDVERTPNKSQHTKLILQKKILPPLPPGLELATFRSPVRDSYQQAILASCEKKEKKSRRLNSSTIKMIIVATPNEKEKQYQGFISRTIKMIIVATPDE